MITDVVKFARIIGFSKIKFYMFVICVMLSIFLELSLFYKIGQITASDITPTFISAGLLVIVEMPYLTVNSALISIFLLILSKFYIVKLTGELAFDFWRRAYQKYFNHILYLNEHKTRSNGEYITFLSSKLEVICQTISIPFLNALNSIIYLMAVTGIAIWMINFQIIIGVMVLCVSGLLVFRLTNGIFQSIAQIVEDEYSALNKAVQSSISSRMELYVNNSSKNIYSILAERVNILTNQKSKTYTYSNFVKILLEGIIYCSLAAIIIFDLPSDIFNLGYLLVIFRSFPHLQALFSLWAHLKSISGLVGDGISIISSNDSLTVNQILLNFGKSDKVTFAVRSDRFTTGSITFEKGRVNVIGGESGIGKSTIVKEVLGLAPASIVQKNKIQKTYFSHTPKISYCGQRPFFLELPIRKIFQLNNDLEISDEGIWAALSLFGLSERIETLDEVLKLDGSNFSGGEMARLSMAIGTSRKPDILVLDETLASLNSVLQEKSYLTLRNSAETLIVITHDQNFLYGDEIFLNIE